MPTVQINFFDKFSRIFSRIYWLILWSMLALPTGSKVAEGNGALCVKIDPDATCPVSATEYLKAEAISAGEKVEAPDPRSGLNGGLKSQPSAKIGVSGTYSEDFQVLTVPLSVPLGRFFTADASLPYIKTPNLEGFGNAYTGLSATFLASSKIFGLGLSLGVRLPSGLPEFGGDRGVVDRYVYGAALLAIKSYQLLATALAITRPLDAFDQDLGDSRVYFLGYDQEITKLFGIYTGVESAYTGPSYVSDRILDGSSLSLTASAGVTTSFYDLRLGMNVPLYQSSRPKDPETGETLEPGVSIEGGFRYDL